MKLRKVKEYEFKSGDIISVNHEGESGELYISIGQLGEDMVFYENTMMSLVNLKLGYRKREVIRLSVSESVQVEELKLIIYH